MPSVNYDGLTHKMAKEKTIAQLAAHFGATERGIKMKLTSEGITETKDFRKDDKKWVQI